MYCEYWILKEIDFIINLNHKDKYIRYWIEKLKEIPITYLRLKSHVNSISVGWVVLIYIAYFLGLKL